MSGYMPQPERLDWGTPQKVFNWAESKWGPYHVDLAASSKNKKCATFLGEEEDALGKDWDYWCFQRMRGWLNPPYGRMLKPFAKQVSKQLSEGNITSVTMLVPSRTDTEWFSILMEHAVEVVFIKGRLKFEGASNSAPFPSVLIHLRKKGKEVVPTLYGVKID